MRLQQMLLAPAVALVMLPGLSTRPAAAAPFEQMKPLALTITEIGNGAFVNNEGPFTTDDNLGYRLAFTLQSGQAGLLILDQRDDWFSNPADSPAVVALLTRFTLDLLAAERGGTVIQIVSPMIGRDTVRFIYRQRGTNATPAVDAIGWRHGSILGIVLLSSSLRVDAEPVARLQQEKLARLRPLPPSPPSTAVIDCASFSHQEAAQTFLAAQIGDPFGLDSDDNGVACDTLPPRRPAPAPPTGPMAGG